MLYVLLALIALSIWLFCLFDVLTTDELDVRKLPKFGWFLIVLLTMNLGAILWLLFGRPHGAEMEMPQTGVRQRRTPRERFPDDLSLDPPYIRPVGPDDDPDFLKSLERRIRGEE
jgi:hypothetical protein